MKKRQLWNFRKDSVSSFNPLDKPLDADPVIPKDEFVPPGYESNPLNYQKPKSIWQKKRERKEVEHFPALNKRPEWVEKLREIYPEIIGMSEEEINAYFGQTPVEDLLRGKIAKSPLWYFSKDEDPDARPYEPADARSVQPDHYPNVMRPGGGYPEAKGEKSGATCNSCGDDLIDGACQRCDWGPHNWSEPINNYPIDPVADERAGIRAASWKFSRRITKDQMVNILIDHKDEIFSEILIPMFQDPNTGDFSWQYSPSKNQSYIYRVAVFNFVKNNNLWTVPKQRSDSDLNKEQALSKQVWEDFKKALDSDFKKVESNFQKYKLIGSQWFEQNPEIYQEIIDKIIKPELYENYSVKDRTTIFNLINGMLNEYGFKITHNGPEWQYKDESKSLGFEKFLWKITKDALEQIKTEDYSLYMEIVYNRETGSTEGAKRIQLCQAIEDVMNDARKENVFGLSLLNDQEIAERVAIELDDPSITGDKIKDVYVYMRNHPTAFIDAHRTSKEIEMAPMRGNPELIERRIGFEAVETRLLQSLRNLINTNERRINLGEDPIQFNYEKWLSESGADKLGFSFGTNVESLRKFLNQIGKKRNFAERINPEWLFSEQSSYDYRKPGQIYVFQIGNIIKIGITNNIRGRIKGYNDSGVGLPKYDEQNWQTIFYDLEKSTEETQLHGADPNFLGTRPWRLKSNVETEQNEQDNAYFVSEVIEDGKIPLRIERAIMSFWQSLGLGVDKDFINRTETISSNPESVEQGVATNLGIDFHVFLISQMLENRGQLQGLNAAFNIEDKRQLLEFFDYDVNKLFETFNNNELGKALKFNFTSDDQGNIASVGADWQKAATFSTKENGTLEKINLLQFNQRSPSIQIDDQENNANFDIMRKHLVGGSLPANQPLKQENINYAIAYLNQVNQEIQSGNLIIDSNTGNVVWAIDPNQIAIAKPWLDYLNDIISNQGIDSKLTTTSSYEGWSNWETWNTKLMIDNEYDLYMQSRRIVEERRPLEQFAEWATQAVIAPHNQQAIADAQEWNETPYEERPTGREDMPEEARELVEGIFGDDSREDTTADILDESKVNWNEIYNSIGEDIKESEAHAHRGGEHELPMEQYTGYTSEELIEAKADQHPWCPLCNPENPDAPGDLTIPSSWT